MQLSNNGRVVIIDDTYEEAKPLMEALGKKCIPYNYYDGEVGGLPDTPHGGIRFVFLDIELNGMKGQDAKTIASGLTGRLQRIVSIDNGPYVIIFWTKHQEVIEQVLANCVKINIAPTSHVDLEKSECLAKDGEYDLTQIINKLNEKLEHIGAFELYTTWENVVSKSITTFVSEFSKLVVTNKDWSKNTSALFYALYKAYVDKNLSDDHNNRFKCACHMMNRGFYDVIEELTNKELALPATLKINQGEVNDDTIAKLNSSLFLGDSILDEPTIGCVISDNNEDILNALKSSIFKQDDQPVDMILCKVIITPECDIAQNKLIQISVSESTHAIHRVVYAVMYPKIAAMKDENKRFTDIGRNANYMIGPIWHDDKQHLLVCHFAGLTMQSEHEITGDTMFTLKRDILFDLQSKAANHVNRLGAQFLK